MDTATLQDPKLLSYICDHLWHPSLAIMVHGSWADGVAKSDSDIDVLVLTAGVLDSQPLPSPFGNIHIEYYPHEQILHEARALDETFRHRILDFSFLVARLRSAIVLQDTHGYAHDLITQLQSYRPSHMTRRKFYVQAVAFRNDAVAALHDGDWALAVLAGRLAAMSLGAGYLLDAGVTNLNMKWQHHFLRREVKTDESFFDRYATVLGVDGADLKQEAFSVIHVLLAMFRDYDTPVPVNNHEQHEVTATLSGETQ